MKCEVFSGDVGVIITRLYLIFISHNLKANIVQSIVLQYPRFVHPVQYVPLVTELLNKWYF